MLVSMARDWPVASFLVLTLAITWIAFIPFYQAVGEAIASLTFGLFSSALFILAIQGG